MKRLAIVALLIFVGFAGWRVGGVLSTDAMGMAVGMVFGVLASLPVALLMLAASRRSQMAEPPPARQQPAQAGGQMPIVVVAPPAYPGYGQPAANQYPQLPGAQASGWAFPPQAARPQRAFTIIGEQAEQVDEW
ncbi:MAG: hypothetical protein DWI57_13485 [Chloroflexi bacterium]|nr:MAG: hypothetical protein DWI57_13485 [Chloroflexota bacterium]